MRVVNWVDQIVRSKIIRHEFLHFVFWGVINTLVMYVLFAMFQLFLQYAIAYTIAYCMGIGFSYYVNSRFVFHGKITAGKAVTYPLVYVVQYLIGLVVLAIFIERFGLPTFLSLPLSTVISIPLTFIMARTIIKR